MGCSDSNSNDNIIALTMVIMLSLFSMFLGSLLLFLLHTASLSLQGTLAAYSVSGWFLTFFFSFRISFTSFAAVLHCVVCQLLSIDQCACWTVSCWTADSNLCLALHDSVVSDLGRQPFWSWLQPFSGNLGGQGQLLPFPQPKVVKKSRPFKSGLFWRSFLHTSSVHLFMIHHAKAATTNN